MVTEWAHSVKPGLRLVTSPIKLSATPVRCDLPPPTLGQHTAEVLQSVLGYSDDTVARLQRQSVI